MGKQLYLGYRFEIWMFTWKAISGVKKNSGNRAAEAEGFKRRGSVESITSRLDMCTNGCMLKMIVLTL